MTTSIPEIVAGLMPSLKSELDELVRIPSVSVQGQVDEPLLQAHDMVARLFAGVGVEVDRLDLPDTAPVVVGQIPAPQGAPTVLLYSHYDVVGVGDESLWRSRPFEPTERGGAIYGRGTADTKSNVIAHVGALRAWEGRPPSASNSASRATRRRAAARCQVTQAVIRICSAPTRL